MVDYLLRPNGDQAVQWTLLTAPSHNVALNDVITQPTSGGNCLAPYNGCIQATDSDDNDVDDLNLASDTIADNITQIVVWVYCLNQFNTFDIDVYNGVGWEGYQTVSIVGAVRWTSKTFGGLNMTQTNLDNCRIRFRASVIGAKDIITIYVAYVIATSAAVPDGIEKVYGIESSAIEKKYGTNWSDIAKIYGIT